MELGFDLACSSKRCIRTSVTPIGQVFQCCWPGLSQVRSLRDSSAAADTVWRGRQTLFKSRAARHKEGFSDTKTFSSTPASPDLNVRCGLPQKKMQSNNIMRVGGTGRTWVWVLSVVLSWSEPNSPLSAIRMSQDNRECQRRILLSELQVGRFLCFRHLLSVIRFRLRPPPCCIDVASVALPNVSQSHAGTDCHVGKFRSSFRRR